MVTLKRPLNVVTINAIKCQVWCQLAPTRPQQNLLLGPNKNLTEHNKIPLICEPRDIDVILDVILDVIFDLEKILEIFQPLFKLFKLFKLLL